MDEQELIRRCQAGDPEAFEPIFRAHAPMAVRTAYLITHDWTTAEDATQEAFARAFRAMKSFRPGEAFAPWLYRIVVNEARRTARRSRVPAAPVEDLAGVPDGAGRGPEEAAVGADRRRRLWAAIQSLPEPQRLALILKYFRGFSEADAAAALGISPGRVKSRLYEARQRLKALLGPFEED